MYVVTVTFALVPGQGERFLPLILENARLSKQQEPGCRQFDVCTDPSRPDDVFLYEVYDSAEAFEDHRRMAHYGAFNEAVDGMVAHKDVRTYGEVR